MAKAFFKASVLGIMIAFFLTTASAEKSFAPSYFNGVVKAREGVILSEKISVKNRKSTPSNLSITGRKLTNNASNNSGIKNPRIKKWSVNSAIMNVEVLIVGGGGGGGRAYMGSGAGGGGGQVVTQTGLTVSSDVTITVGSGGSGGTGGTIANGSIYAPNTISRKTPFSGANGDQSSFGSYIAYGGGGSQLATTLNSWNTFDDEKGGNAYGSTTSTVYTGGSRTYGNNGGWYYTGGGGAGAGGNGVSGNNNNSGANGGPGGTGVSSSLRTGSSLYYGGGGGGSGWAPSNSSLEKSQGTGGNGGGGNGVGGSSTGNNGSANSGGGGGGSGSGNAGAGGSGIVVVRYAASSPMASGGTITSYSSGGITYQVHTFTSSGTFAPAASPPSASVISGTASICSGASTNLSVAITDGTSPYTLVYTDGTSNTQVNNYTSGTNIPVSPSTTTTYSIVSVTDANGLTGTGNSGSAVVTVNSRPTPSFTNQPGASVCTNTNVTYTTQSGQTNYTWTIPGTLNTDYSITSGGVGTSSNTVTLKWLTAGSKTVTINYSSANGCAASSATSSTATTVNAAPVVAGVSQNGAFGNGLNLEGANDYVVLPNPISNAFTIEYWVKSTQTSPTGSQWYEGNGIVDAEYGGGTTDFGTALLNGKLAFGVGNSDVTIQSTTSINAGSWNHVAVSWNGTTGAMKLYINGNEEATTTGPTGTRAAVSRIVIGRLQTDINNFDGSVDDLRIWNVVRTQSEIQAAKNSEMAGTETGLVAYYNFNQGTANGTNTGISTLTDRTSNGNNGTLVGFALTGSTSNWSDGAQSTGGSSSTLTVCANSTIQLSNATAGGVWSTSDANIATVDNTGLVTGVAEGSVTISYTVTNASNCSTSATTTITVNALPSFLTQPSAAAQSVCSGAGSLNVEVDPGSGTVASYKWYSNASSSTSGGSLVVTNTTTSSTNSYAPTSTAYYYATIINSNGCVGTSTVSGLVTVTPAPSISSQPSSATQSICINGTPTNLSVTSAAGSGTISTYKWYSNTTNSNTGGTLISTTVGTSITNSYTPSTSVAGTTYYYCVVTNSNGCSTTSTVSGAITVSSASVAGTAAASSTVISTGGTTTLSLSGYTGSIQWQQSADGSTGWSNVSGGTGATTATYTTSTLSATTYYKALVTNGVCAAASSNNVTVTVPATGVVANILVVAAGGSGGAHKGGEGTGGGGGGGVVHITGTTLSNATYTVTVAGTTAGRSVTAGTGCGGGGLGNHGGNSIFSGDSKTITAIGGGGGGGACSGNGDSGGSGGGGHAGSATNPNTGGSVTLNTTSGLSGGTISLYGNIGGTSPSVQNGGGGGGATAAPGTSLNGGAGVTISITGTANVYGSGGGANCTNSTGGSGGTNAGNGASGYTSSRTGLDAANNFGGGGGGNNSAGILSGTGGSGVVIISYASPVAMATGGTITSYSNGGVTYQVHTFTSSGSFVLNVVPVFYVASTGVATGVCTSASARTTSLPYTASGGSPTSYTIDWNAAANTAGFADQGSTSHAFASGGGSVTGITIPANIAAGTYTGTMTISNGSSTTTQSISLAIGSVSGTITGAGTVSSGTNSTTLTLSGYSGSIQWQSSTNNSTYSNIGGATSATYTATNLTATTFYKAVVTNGVCASVTSSAATITIASPSTAFGITGSATANTMSNNVATVVDPAISVNANGTISGFTVTITSDYTDGDILGYTGSLPSGVSVLAFDVTSRSLYFTGTASAADWQTLLRTVTLTSTSNCYPTNRKVSFLPSNKYFNYFNGHYYEYKSTALSWTAAKSAASSLSFYGRKGYLVTISSEAENNFIWKLIAHDSWIGASCQHTEINAALGYNKFGSTTYGQFYWVTGPEKGTSISNGLGSSLTPVAGIYSNWNPQEPNNYKGWGENSGHMFSSSGYWNDYKKEGANNGRDPIPYIVEYGGSPGDDESATISFTRDIIISGSPAGTISGAATVCNGTNSTTLTFSGGGTVQRWEYSTDNFVTAGTTVPSTTSTLTATNLSSSRYYRAVVNTSGCTNLASSSALITVATSTAGTITATSADVCAGGNAALTLNGNSGSIQKWQVSTSSDFTTGVSDISNTTNSLSHALASNGTYYFRASVLNSACVGGTAVYTDGYPVTVTSGTPPVGGTVNSVAFCGGSNSGTLTLSGSTGTSYQWEVSTDGGTAWSDASSTSTSQSYTGVSTTTKYRVLVTNGSCGSVYSSVGTITIGGTSGAQWTGTVSTDWGNTANWCGYIIGDDGLDVEISATATYAPTLDRSRTIGNLNFNASGKSVTLGNYTLTVSSFSGASSNNYIKTTGTGKLQVSIGSGIITSLPIGNAGYNPVSISNNSGSSDYFSARILDEVYANSVSGTLSSNGRVKRTWDISKTNANGGSGVNFVFSWNAGETTGLTIPSLFAYSSGNWVKQTGTTSYTSTSLTYSGYTGTLTSFAMLQGIYTWSPAGINNLWSNGNNWSTGSAPAAGAEIIISSGTPQVDADYAVSGSLTLSGSGTLTINPGKTLSIPVGGVADFGGKLVTFKSDATGTGQLGTVAGTLSNATNILVERYIPAGKRAFRFFGSPVTTTTTIRQNWMEGATPGVLAGYPYRTVSAYNPILGYGTLITGAGGNANGFDESQTNNPSLFTFNNSTGVWVTSTNTSATIAAGSAYRLFVRGDRSYGITASSEPPAGSTILRTTGTIAQGQLTSGTQLPALSQAASGWSLIGNPYQSVVDMSSADVVKTNLTPYYYVWDPRMATRGAYVAYNYSLNTSSNGSSAVNRYAQPGQAFFVQNTTAGSNSIVFKEAAKGAASNQTATFARNNTRAGAENGYTIDATAEKAEPSQTLAVNYASLSTILYYTDSLAAGAAAMDATRVLFGSQFSNIVDGNDGRKFTNLDETMAIKQGTNLLSMELRGLPDTSTIIPLNITQYVDKKYTMRLFWDEKLSTDTLIAYLRDKYTNKETEIKKTGNTDVEYLLDADAKSSAADRFEIIFKRSSNQVTAVINYDNGQYIKIYPNPVRTILNIDFDLGQNRLVGIKVYDMAGRLVMDRPGMRKGSSLIMTGLAKGTYNVKVWGSNGKLLMSEKIIKD